MPVCASLSADGSSNRFFSKKSIAPVSSWVLYSSWACLARVETTYVNPSPGLYRPSVVSLSGVHWALPDESSAKRLHHSFMERSLQGAFKCAGLDGMRRFAYKRIHHACLGSARYRPSEAAAALPARPTYPLISILYALASRSTEHCVEQNKPYLVHLQTA